MRHPLLRRLVGPPAVLGMMIASAAALVAAPAPSAVAAPNDFVFAPMALPFDPTYVGDTSGPLSVTVTNADGVVRTPAFVGADFGPTNEFQLAGDTCTGSTLHPGATCTFTYTFTPHIAGSTVTEFKAIGVDGDVHDIELSGTGLAAWEMSTDTVALGDLYVGTGGNQLVTLTNISPTSRTPTVTGDWESASDNCSGQSVAAGGLCTFTAGVRATHVGPIELAGSVDVDGQQFPLTVTAVGVSPFSLSPATLDFGDVAIASVSASLEVELSNVSPDPLAAIDHAQGTVGAPFSAPTETCSGTSLQPGQACTFSFTFHPVLYGPATGTATVEVELPFTDSEQFTVDVAGFGIIDNSGPPAPWFASVPDSVYTTRGEPLPFTGTDPVSDEDRSISVTVPVDTTSCALDPANGMVTGQCLATTIEIVEPPTGSGSLTIGADTSDYEVQPTPAGFIVFAGEAQLNDLLASLSYGPPDDQFVTDPGHPVPIRIVVGNPEGSEDQTATVLVHVLAEAPPVDTTVPVECPDMTTTVATTDESTTTTVLLGDTTTTSTSSTTTTIELGDTTSTSGPPSETTDPTETTDFPIVSIITIPPGIFTTTTELPVPAWRRTPAVVDQGADCPSPTTVPDGDGGGDDGGTLPVTGSDATTLVLVAVGLLAAGIGLMAARRD